MRELPTNAKLDEAHALCEERPLVHQAIGTIRLAQHRATLEEVRRKWEDEDMAINEFTEWLTAQLEADDGEA